MVKTNHELMENEREREKEFLSISCEHEISKFLGILTLINSQRDTRGFNTDGFIRVCAGRDWAGVLNGRPPYNKKRKKNFSKKLSRQQMNNT
jgi:hypothetical protein